MATERHFEYIFVLATVADSDKIILIWDNDRKVSAKFHFRFMIFNDFMKNTKKKKDYGSQTPSWISYSSK